MYDFQGALFDTPRQMCAAIAHEWITAGGQNDHAAIRYILARRDDAALAAECVEDWGLDRVVNADDVALAGEGPETWLERRDADADMLRDAFAALRGEYLTGARR